MDSDVAAVSLHKILLELHPSPPLPAVLPRSFYLRWLLLKYEKNHAVVPQSSACPLQCQSRSRPLRCSSLPFGLYHVHGRLPGFAFLFLTLCYGRSPFGRALGFSSVQFMFDDPLVLCCSRPLGCAFLLCSLCSACSCLLDSFCSVCVMPAAVCLLTLLSCAVCAMPAAVRLVAFPFCSVCTVPAAVRLTVPSMPVDREDSCGHRTY